ncbi:MAG: hypothetical protein JSU77_04470 [Fidelibacterota bacterium]|nr:MAG: hypothetical protein JSU77_04470 [Candidatus Neomarinimicrobiota bacterium]
MKARQLLTEAATFFVIVFVATLIVSFIYTLLDKGSGEVDWELAIRNGFLFALVFPTYHLLKKK